MDSSESNFELKAPIGAQLRAILEDYPGCQILSEALQNSEDGEADSIHICLNLNQCDAPTNVRGMEQYSGPAFYIIDNGKGINDNGWESIANLHESKKRNSPDQIGRYGMGTRSFFHFTDIIQVVSNNYYVVIDPLRKVYKRGWRSPIIEMSKEEKSMFSIDSSFNIGDGAVFRLPLRILGNDNDNDSDSFGLSINPTDAENLMKGWADQLKNGQILLFLSHVKEVKISIWEVGKREPTILAKVKKNFKNERLPSKWPALIPIDMRKSFENLNNFMNQQISSPELENISKINISIIELICDDTHVHKWLLAEQFSVNRELLDLINKCKSVPMIGVAIPFDSEVILNGKPFCFLPIGEMTTMLPVHLNASFQVAKNRRSLWIGSKGDTSNNSGTHASWYQWNKILMEKVIPELWKAAFEYLIGQLPVEYNFLKLLPNLCEVEDVWRACAHNFLGEISNIPFLTNALAQADNDSNNLVSPSESQAIIITLPISDTEKSDILSILSNCCKNCYSNPDIDNFLKVVFIPFDIQENLTKYSGLKNVNFNDFIETVLVPRLPPELLSQPLLKLAELADRYDFIDHQMWLEILSDLAWVPIETNNFQKLQSTYCIEGRYAQLHIVHKNHLKDNIRSPAITRSLEKWGMKTNLTWCCAVEEAQLIHDVESAELFLQYMYDNYESMSKNIDKISYIKKLQTIPFLPSFCPSNNPISDLTETLQAANDVYAQGDHSYLWSVHSCASRCVAFLRFPEVEYTTIVEQIIRLSALYSLQTITQEQMLKHLTVALEKLISIMLPRDWDEVNDRLKEVSWIPCMLIDGRVILFKAANVVQQRNFLLDPYIGLLIHEWKSKFQHSLSCIQIAAIASVEMLKVVLNYNRNTPFDKEMCENYVNELALRLDSSNDKANRSFLVPTESGKLLDSSNVYINDAPWARYGDNIKELLSSAISPKNGLLLGCTSVRDLLAKDCEEDPAGFGQEEKLVDRIKGLLKDYNEWIDIFKEHFQNCDDAGAEAILFLLDDVTYDNDKLCDNRIKELQGPSLFLCSSKALTKNDITLIQRLGNSNKKSSFPTAGCFGVGLNSFYHLTDSIQLLANGHLYIFDPSRKFVARDTGPPGAKYSISQLENLFPSNLEPFKKFLKGGVYFKDFPTVFRLPLRHNVSLLGKKVELSTVVNLMKEFTSNERISELLLISKYVSRLLISFNNSDDPIEYRISKSLKVNDFIQYLPTSIAEIRSYSREKQVVYFAEILNENNKSRWLVVHSISNDEPIVSLSEDILNHSESALLPLGSVAFLLDDKNNCYDGNISSFSPLNKNIGLPLLINGCFHLHSSRKLISFPTGDSSDLTKEWNKQLVEGPIASSYISMLKECTELVNQGGLSIHRFLDLFQLFDSSNNCDTKELREILSKTIVETLSKMETSIFPILDGETVQ